MASGITDRQHYENIADAIRSRNGEITTYKPSEMADAIRAIAVSRDVASLNIYESIGTFVITCADGGIITGSATFDDNGLPASLTDDAGNAVTFTSGYPTSVTNQAGTSVSVVWG